MYCAHTHTHIPFPPFPLHNETGRDYRSNVMVMICVISKDTRSPLAKHEFWKMPFDKKISSKHRTLKCHFTPLTSSGTGVKQQTGSKAGAEYNELSTVGSPGSELFTSVSALAVL